MKPSQVFTLLEQNQNQRGIEHWKNLKNTDGLTSYGIGLTVHRKLAKKIGKNRELAKTLWQSNNYDAKVIALLIDDPKQITIEQAEVQVEQLNSGMLSHVFSSCDATLAKSPIVFELTKRWFKSSDPMRRRCAYGLIYEMSKKKSKIYNDDFFMSIIHHIANTFYHESKAEKLAMGVALMGIGKRNITLNQSALTLAATLSPIDFNEEGEKCAPFDIVKHLTSKTLKNKLGLT